MRDGLLIFAACGLCAFGLATFWVPALLLNNGGPYWFEIGITIVMLAILTLMLLALRQWRNL